ncbi:unnamed protein product [Lactuca saligna]|uniref:Uncharacterized protein n=1 Tax=Lactuca saligna TaxID=75948 RepID=A0AA35V4Q2_LACSI|nr:unnamed protein product [Lactuca saligna]
MQKIEPTDNNEAQSESRLSDAETIAKAFAQLYARNSFRNSKHSIMRNPSAADPTIVIVKNPHYLLLISETFMEARAALCRSGITNLPSQSPIKVDEPSIPPVSAPLHLQFHQEPTIVTSMPPVTVPILAPSFQHVPPVPRPTPPMQMSSPLSVSQDMLSSNDGIQDM